MKMKLLTGIAALSIFGLTACDESAKLAKEVEGTWSAPKTEVAFMQKGNKDKHYKGSNDRYESTPATKPEMKPSMACTPTITFTRTQGTNGGDISISAVYEVTEGVTVTDTVTAAPVKATVSGTVMAAGTWMADDDDDIAVTLDDSKTVVKVDPSTLTLNYATLTDASVAELDTLKGKVANNIAAAVTPTLQRHIAKLHKLDDVKVLGNSMKMEIGKTKFNFTKK